MKRLFILLLLLNSSTLHAQRVLKHTLLPQGVGAGVLASFTKVTDYRILYTDSKGLVYNFMFIAATGDTIKSFSRKANFEDIIRVNEQGVCLGIRMSNKVINGFTMDSNGVLIDTFRHSYGNTSLYYSPKFLDSYTDSNGNVVIHATALVGRPVPYTIVIHFTLNQFGQLLKYKEYGPTGLIGGLSKGSKLLVKDGKLWGFTAITQDGVIGIGIDTAGFTGQSYYLSKTITTSSIFSYSVLPYKRNGYYTYTKGVSKAIIQKSEIDGVPVLVDSLTSGVFSEPFWVSSDSTRLSIKWPTNPREVTRLTESGTTLGFLRIREDSLMNMKGAFAFGDGSWIVISSNPRTLQFPGYPYMLTRISDMGYPYDPWKQQVVFKGVTGTAKEQEKPAVLAYPNPTQDRLKFLGMAEGNVRLIDATGKEILSQTLTEEGISLAHLPRGLYRYLVTYRGKYYQGSVVRE